MDPITPLVVVLAGAAIGAIGGFVGARVQASGSRTVASLTTESQERVAEANRQLQLAIVEAQANAQKEIERIKVDGQRQIERDRTVREDRKRQVEPYREYVNRSLRRYQGIFLALVNQQEPLLNELWQKMRDDDLSFSDLRYGEVTAQPFLEAGARFQELDNSYRARLMAHLNRHERQQAMDDFRQTFEALMDAANALSLAATEYVFAE